MNKLLAGLCALLAFVAASAVTNFSAGLPAALFGAASAASSVFSAAASAVMTLSVAASAAFSTLSAAALAVIALSVSSRRSSRSARRSPWPLVFLALVALSGFVLGAPWDAGLCVRPTGIGAPNAGAPFTILASAGSSVRRLRVYRNNGKDGYLRGIVAFFSDGSDQRGGVRKDQFSEVVFGDGEVITGMTLWSLPRSRSSSAPRVARVDISTNARSWGYGMEDTSRLSAKAVDTGSGVLVGFQGRAGDDLDQLAPIFLKPLSDSRVDGIVFDPIGDKDGLRLVTLREGSARWNGTDYSWTFSGSESRDTSTTFSSGTSNGLSLSTTFSASIPKVLDASFGASWTSGTTQSRDRHSGSSTSLSWSTSISLTKDNASVWCAAMVWEGRLNIGWSGTQTVTADGYSSSFPVSGTLSHVAYGKVETVCRPLDSTTDSDSSTDWSSDSDKRKLAKRWTA